MIRFLPLFALLACTSGTEPEDQTETMIAEYEATLADVEALVHEHNDAVKAVLTLEEAGELEAAFATDWEAHHAAMADMMSSMDGCEMDDEDMGMMDDADMSMGDMDADMMDHTAGHDDHGDISACHTAEDDLAAAMSEHMDAMMPHGEHWRDSMHCEDMGGMHM